MNAKKAKALRWFLRTSGTDPAEVVVQPTQWQRLLTPDCGRAQYRVMKQEVTLRDRQGFPAG